MAGNLSLASHVFIVNFGQIWYDIETINLVFLLLYELNIVLNLFKTKNKDMEITLIKVVLVDLLLTLNIFSALITVFFYNYHPA